MIRLFEMFSGYGGASFALQKAGVPFECVGISEIDKYAVTCYNNNFSGVKNFGDCTKIIAEDLPDFDLLTGGFPCQDVSNAGLRDLSKGRTNLYKEVLRIAEVKKPKYILLENVGGLSTMIVATRQLVNIVVSDFKKLGYSVAWKLLNSKDYGVPQSRPRIWIVCKLGEQEFNWFQFPNKDKKMLFLKDILEKEVSEDYFISKEKERRQLTSKFQSRVKSYILHPEKTVSPCLLHSGSPLPKLRINDKHRYITPKEAFRIMGFLDDEINLTGISEPKLYQLAGNGWCTRPSSDILKELLKNEQ